MVAVVLTGGASRRMGEPKAWLPVGGRACLDRVAAACREAGADVEFQGFLEGLGDRFPGTPAWPDPEPGSGPLAALAAALARAPRDAVLLVAADMPFLRPALLRAAAEAVAGGADWAVPEHGGRLHPLAAAYGPAVLPRARALLAAGRRDMHALLDEPALRGVRLSPQPAWGDPDRLLLNVNTPDDLALARRLAEGDPPSAGG